jgi:hypothetical protein
MQRKELQQMNKYQEPVVEIVDFSAEAVMSGLEPGSNPYDSPSV